MILRITIRSLGLLFFAAWLALVFCSKPTLYGDAGFSAAVKDRDHRLLRLSLASDDRYRLLTPLDNINSEMIAATLLYEDRQFYSHPGVNPAAIVRAAWTTYVSGTRKMGASTITMQLARKRFDLNTRSVGGKLLQMIRAVQLERHYTKDQILEAYLNIAPYGGNIEGVGAAALVYFDKPAAQLSLPEATALAVIPQNPARRNPVTQSGLEQLLAARQRLIAAWQQTKSVSREMNALLKLPPAIRSTKQLPFYAPHFAQNVIDRNRSNPDVYVTSLQLDIQNALTRKVQAYIERNQHRGIDNASAMLVDYRTMKVLASVGSADFMNADILGQVDGTQAKRSPGSTLKPFVYGMAIDQGEIHPMSMLRDAPKRFGVYTPENFDRGFLGPVFARDALIYSRNVPAIDMLSQVGQESFHTFLTAGGVSALRNPEHYGLALILGGVELTMEELTRLYAMLANDGKYQRLEYLSEKKSSYKPEILLSAEASFLVLDMLRDNPRPGALELASAQQTIPIAWKTGTSYAFRDAWTAGVFGPYVLTVWVGNFDGSSNPAFVGRQAAAPLFFEIADLLTARLSPQDYQREPALHLNVREVDVCASTGDLPGKHCPETSRAWFIPGVSPIKTSNVHRSVAIDTNTGRRSCNFETDQVREEVFEFWPSDITHLFQQAGISLRRPPPWAQDCSLDLRAASGVPPVITSPAPGLGYHIRPDKIASEHLPLTATTDADVSSLFWFVNDRFVAKVARDEPYLWQPQTGEFDILVVDDLGRSQSSSLAITIAQ